MKLHLTKSLRAALLACVSGALTSQTMADGTALPDYNQWGNYELNADNTEWDLLTFSWTTTESNTDISDTGKIYLSNKSGTQLNVASGTVTINAVMGGGSYEKTGDGTLVLSAIFSDSLPTNATISEGVLQVNAGGNNGFVAGTATVAGGATLKLSATDTLGYSGDYWGGNFTDAINLNGTDADNVATLQVDSTTTLSTNINLNGFAAITGAGNLRAFDGTITATGSNNSISTTLMTRKDLNVVVAENGALTISGTIEDADNTDYTSKNFIKSGAGTLTLASSATVDSAVVFIVDAGIVALEGSTDRSYTLRGGELQLNNNRTGLEDGSSAQKITLANETDGTTSENTISSTGSAGAVFTDVTGTGNLTLKNSVNVYADMDFTGDMTLTDGTYNIGYSGYGVSPTIANNGDISIASTATVKMDAQSGNSATLIQNSGDITVNGSLEVSKASISNGGTITISGENSKMMVNSSATIASDIVVADGGTLDVGTSPAMSAAGVTVELGGTLDLKDTEALTLQSLDLNDGTTIVLGSSTRITISDALTIGEGVIFDVSSWCTYDSFTPYELFTFTGDSSNLLLPQNVTIKTSTANNEVAFLTYDSVSGKVALVPEPTTATLSLLALAGLAMRRRRK